MWQLSQLPMAASDAPREISRGSLAICANSVGGIGLGEVAIKKPAMPPIANARNTIQKRMLYESKSDSPCLSDRRNIGWSAMNDAKAFAPP